MLISVVDAKIWYVKKCTVFIGPPCSYEVVAVCWSPAWIVLSSLSLHAGLCVMLLASDVNMCAYVWSGGWQNCDVKSNRWKTGVAG